MTNWNSLDYISLARFANGTLSGRSLYARYKNTDNGGVVRNLLRENGVDKARRLAKKALRRRQKSAQ